MNLLAETVWLNYMALHGELGHFSARFPNHSLGNAASLDKLAAFNPIVSGPVFPPPDQPCRGSTGPPRQVHCCHSPLLTTRRRLPWFRLPPLPA